MTAKASRRIKHAELFKTIDYDPLSGVFTWRRRLGARAEVGEVAGTIVKKGHRHITIRGRRYLAGRLAWFYMMGEWPAGPINHRNLNPDDNRFENLRRATQTQLVQTRRPFAWKTLPKGVSARAGGRRFRARIRVNGDLLSLGDFPTAAEAAREYTIAATLHFGEFARAA